MIKKINKFKGLRVMNGYLQKDLAEHLGISRNNYALKENEQRFTKSERKILALLYEIDEKELEV